jgi:hypothetical protein
MLNLPRNLEKQVAQELYRPDHRGAISVPHAVWNRTRKELHAEIEQLPFEKKPERYGNAVQRFEGKYFTPQTLPTESLLKALHDSYAAFIGRLTPVADFDGTPVTEIGVHHYFAGGDGMTAHIDESKFRNIIGIFVVAGSAPFWVGKHRDGTDASYQNGGPGSLILMRAPRNDEEKALRPFHAVGHVIEDRYSIVFRQELKR